MYMKMLLMASNLKYENQSSENDDETNIHSKSECPGCPQSGLHTVYRASTAIFPYLYSAID